jgi:cytoplasmic iron level regulating protein YaaA (DUF328/UPF0246 family)
MLVILSPTKSLDFTKQSITQDFSIPKFQKESSQIMQELKGYSSAEIEKLMNISENLLLDVYSWILDWNLPFTEINAKQAILSYKGEVFNGLQANNFNTAQLLYAQQHLRILSGLHGILKPLDLIQPYRLEMLTKLTIDEFDNLYKFWEHKIVDVINTELENHKNPMLINLASGEYSKALPLKAVRHRIITPVFKEMRGDDFKVVTIYAKKARGLMTKFIIENEIDEPTKLVLFNAEGYYYNEELSSENEIIFVR